MARWWWRMREGARLGCARRAAQRRAAPRRRRGVNLLPCERYLHEQRRSRPSGPLAPRGRSRASRGSTLCDGSKPPTPHVLPPHRTTSNCACHRCGVNLLPRERYLHERRRSRPSGPLAPRGRSRASRESDRSKPPTPHALPPHRTTSGKAVQRDLTHKLQRTPHTMWPEMTQCGSLSNGTKRLRDLSWGRPPVPVAPQPLTAYWSSEAPTYSKRDVCQHA